MRPIKLIIKTNESQYPIVIGSNLIAKLSMIVKQNSITFNKCLFIIDQKVPNKLIINLKKSFKKKKVFFLYLKANEKNKNQKTINRILEFLLRSNFSRQDCLVAVGGGITGDIGGFVSSLFKRGLQFINIPTTLLSQVDSSVGGKTGINTKYGKNLIGSFYQPRLVISDSIFLKTLPRREIICGYGEILKHSLIANKVFYNFLNTNILNILNLKSPFIEKAIFESCKIKKLIVEKDEKEKGLRKILNFGHTFAHAYEATLGYSKKLNHGEAVLLGITSALKFSHKNKILNDKEYYLIAKHIKSSSLPYNLSSYFSLKHLDKILSFMSKDKKNNSEKISLVLLRKIGQPIFDRNYYKSDLKLFLKNQLTN
jgi:3-dehydroquinate synthase